MTADDQRSLARPLAVSLAVVVLVVITAVVAYQRGHDAGASTDAAGGAAGTTEPASASTLKPQPVDTGFAADMVDHHEQAVQLSLLAIDKAESTAVRQLALEIATGQRREAGQLTQFLVDRGIDRTDPQRTVMAWMDEPTPHDRMPGLATPEQVVALTNATGPEVDRLFVQLMAAHHRGASTWPSTQPRTPRPRPSGTSPPAWSSSRTTRSPTSAPSSWADPRGFRFPDSGGASMLR